MGDSTQISNIIQIPGMDPNIAGATVWWRMSKDIDYDRLKAAWDAAGLPSELMIKKPTAQTALWRAMSSFQTTSTREGGKKEHRLIARPMKGTKGWTLILEVAVDEELEHISVLSATIGEGGILRSWMGQLTGREMDEYGIPGQASLMVAYERAQDRLITNDISAWLTSLVRFCDAVSLRDTGGFYFIPRDPMHTFRDMVEVIRSVSDHVIFEMPALKTDEAVAAIMDALLSEADTEVSAMETELDTKTLGARALKTRESKCASLRAKLKGYEDLLGITLDKMAERVEGLEASIVTASLAAADSE